MPEVDIEHYEKKERTRLCNNNVAGIDGSFDDLAYCVNINAQRTPQTKQTGKNRIKEAGTDN